MHFYKAESSVDEALSIVKDTLNFDENPIDSQTTYHQVRLSVRKLKKSLQSVSRELDEVDEILRNYGAVEKECVKALEQTVGDFRKQASIRESQRARQLTGSKMMEGLGWLSLMACLAFLGWFVWAPTPASRTKAVRLGVYSLREISKQGRQGVACAAAGLGFTVASLACGFVSSESLKLAAGDDGSNVSVEAVVSLMADTRSCLQDSERERRLVAHCKQELSSIREALEVDDFTSVKVHLQKLAETIASSIS